MRYESPLLKRYGTFRQLTADVAIPDAQIPCPQPTSTGPCRS